MVSFAAMAKASPPIPKPANTVLYGMLKISATIKIAPVMITIRKILPASEIIISSTSVDVLLACICIMVNSNEIKL